VVPVEVARDVEVDDVPRPQGPVVGYAVAYDLVDGRAAALGEIAVVQRRRIRPPLDRRVVHDPVDFVAFFFGMSRHA
jgi:hypothetical protein